MTQDDISISALAVPSRLVDRTEPVLPPHISQDQIETMARDYWSRISTLNWTSLTFEQREGVVLACMHHLALAWSAKEAGVG